MLNQILLRIPAPSGPTFRVHRQGIEITTGGGWAVPDKVLACMPAHKLLPVPPRPGPTGPLLTDDLTQVPEVDFQQPLSAREAILLDPLLQGTSRVEDIEIVATAHRKVEQMTDQVAKVRHLNRKKTDGFMEVLLAHRPDLAGLPFVLGEACRSKPERMTVLAAEISMVRLGLDPKGKGESDPTGFWDRYEVFRRKGDRNPGLTPPLEEPATAARVAALMQIFGPEDGPPRLGLVEYLASVPHSDATMALARLALFSPEEPVRRAAVAALRSRSERDYTPILMSGFRYPWPAVARRASEALVKLGRVDLLARLVDVLEQPDPRAPVVQQIEGRRVPVVRELVRINHHRNCLLCHAPVEQPDSRAPVVQQITGVVPLPGEPLPSSSEYYSGPGPGLLVRVDVTYLRQDFSLMQPVANADPWPEMQRFDFLVRTRILSEEEAQTYRDRLQLREPGVLSPYHRAALFALRELSGRDAEPTPQAWR